MAADAAASELRGLAVAQAAFGAALAGLSCSPTGRGATAAIAAAARGAVQGALTLQGHVAPQQEMEEVLECVGRAAHLGQKPTVTEAKAKLRAMGERGAGAAKRIGRLSKGRNVACHPDTSLQCDILELFAEGACQEAEEAHFGCEEGLCRLCAKIDMKMLEVPIQKGHAKGEGPIRETDGADSLVEPPIHDDSLVEPPIHKNFEEISLVEPPIRDDSLVAPLIQENLAENPLVEPPIQDNLAENKEDVPPAMLVEEHMQVEAENKEDATPAMLKKAAAEVLVRGMTITCRGCAGSADADTPSSEIPKGELSFVHAEVGDDDEDAPALGTDEQSETARPSQRRESESEGDSDDGVSEAKILLARARAVLDGELGCCSEHEQFRAWEDLVETDIGFICKKGRHCSTPEKYEATKWVPPKLPKKKRH